MKNYKVLIFVLATLLIAGSSCTKVVNINLNAAHPSLVVAAEITDQPGPCFVNLSQTVNFSDDNVFPAVSGAAVTISDDAGNSVKLLETSSGNYTSTQLQGTPGRLYVLSITAYGQSYTASCRMPLPVFLDSLVADTSGNQRFIPGGGGGHGTTIRTVFTDPKGTVNYYRLLEYVNGGAHNSNIIVVSDNLQDGSVIRNTLARHDTGINTGDTLTVALESIDAGVYQYYRTLRLVTREQTGIQTSVSGNPTSNISNKALGYFSAYSVRSKYIISP